MTDTERLDLIGHTVDYVRGRCKVIAGTGSNATTHAITLSKEAEKLGADGLLLVSPYYNKATEAGLIAHYTAIGDQVHLPCIVYNVPSRTGVNIPVSVYQALSHHPNFCGVKEASGDIVKIARIRQACGPEFPSGPATMTRLSPSWPWAATESFPSSPTSIQRPWCAWPPCAWPAGTGRPPISRPP